MAARVFARMMATSAKPQRQWGLWVSGLLGVGAVGAGGFYYWQQQQNKNYGQMLSLSPLSEDQVAKRLNANAKVIRFPKEIPVSHVEIASIAANQPMEDAFGSAFLTSKESSSCVIGVFDGHGAGGAGYATSRLAAKHLPSYCLHYASDATMLENAALEAQNKGDAVSMSLIMAFRDFDWDIAHDAACSFAENMLANTPKETWIKATELGPAFAGSCAVVAHVVKEPEKAHLRIANLGDCRAVLGQCVQDEDDFEQWDARDLSQDHTAANEMEVERILKAHPGEENSVLRGSRLLGILQPLRALGEFQFKTPSMRNLYPGYKPTPFRSPPYLSNEPEVLKRVIQPKDRFVILASDGLWDNVTSEEAVHVVAEYVSEREKRRKGEKEGVKAGAMGEIVAEVGAGGWKEDSNAAVALLRAALGRHMAGTLLAAAEMDVRTRRMLHDDITVAVVFLHDDGENEGGEMVEKVVVPPEMHARVDARVKQLVKSTEEARKE